MSIYMDGFGHVEIGKPLSKEKSTCMADYVHITINYYTNLSLIGYMYLYKIKNNYSLKNTF